MTTRLKLACAALLCAASAACAQSSPADPFNTSGHLFIGSKSVPYLIRHLPPDSFPTLPAPIQSALTARGCLIPQTYEAHHPENVTHGSFEHPGSSDWAVLCSVKGTVSLLVFFASRSAADPVELASAPETERLQANNASRTFAFNWAIDAASPQQVHDAQAGLDPRPAFIDHDALADSTVERRTIYHFFAKGAWTLLDMPQP